MMNLTQYEKEMINTYINLYGGLHKAQSVDTLDYRLRFWYQNKVEFYHMLGDQLIYKFPINVEESTDQLINRISDDLYDNPGNILYEFRRTVLDTIYSNQPLGEALYDYMYIIDNLLDAEVLATNKYSRKSAKIPFPSGNVIQVPNGCKPTKPLAKIAAELGLTDMYEQFRIKLSTYFNTRKITGDMCISIHPLDFMTMSDNDHSWKSCMSWQDKGCYRRGTVEMMNSAAVVVAYLDDHSSSLHFGDYKWNSKRWRSLFVINDDIITSVKGYPYQHEGMAKLVLDKLNELMGGKYNTPFSGYDIRYNDDGYNYPYYFYTNHMYNDFGTTIHYALFSDKFAANPRTEEFNYSGNDVCMQCGQEDYDYIDPNDYDNANSDTLVCSDCLDLVRCANCGRYECRDWMYETDEGYICEDCYTNGEADAFDPDVTHYIDSWYNIHIVNDDIQSWMEKNYTYHYLPYFRIHANTLDKYDTLDIPFLNDKTLHKDANGDYYYNVSQLNEEALRYVDGPYWLNLNDLFKEDFFNAIYERHNSRVSEYCY